MTIEELKEQAIDCIRQIGNAHLNHKEQKIDDVFEEQKCALTEISVETKYTAQLVKNSQQRCKR